MTEKTKRGERQVTRLGAFALIACGASLILLVINSENALRYAKDGLYTCAFTLIPSLFPFMVISDILVKAGATSFLAGLFEKPMRTLFLSSGEGAGAAFLGALCGFPIGARCAVSLYDTGKISRSECEKLICFTNNPSIAFVVSAVGLSLFGSKRAGAELYVITVLSSLVIGAVFCRFGEREKKSDKKRNKAAASSFGIKDIAGAIGDSATGVIRVCAFVVFFSVALGMIKDAAETLGATNGTLAVLLGIVELTGGVAEAAKLLPSDAAYIAAAFALSWSGISVHFQIMSICSGTGINLRPYFLAKLLQGALAAGIAGLRIKLSPVDLQTVNNTRLVSTMPHTLTWILLVFFGVSLTAAIAKSVKR